MATSSLHTLPALVLAKLVREGAISSEELVRHHLARIEVKNPSLSAFVTVFDDAVKVARRKDRERLRHRDSLPPFHGVPIGIKDLNAVRFTRTRFGSRGMPAIVLPCDDANVGPLRRAGFVILGKLATSELGAMPVIETDIHPPTRNPWSPTHTAGGSSGGSGAAVAAGMLPIAQGSDGAGSIRIPSSFCGLYGLKPSRGRIVNQFRLPDRRILYTSGPMARTVSDAAALLDVMAGIDTGRTHWAPPPARPFAVRHATPKPLRIKVVESTGMVPTDPDILLTLRHTARILERMGHVVEEAQLPESGLDEFLPIWQRLIGGIPLMRWSRAQPVTAWLHEGAKGLKRREVDALEDRLVDRYAPEFGTADLWLTPTVAVGPPPIGAWAGLPPHDAFAEAAKLAAFTAVVNLVGLPAASIPAGLSPHGLPIGVQLIGGMFRESDVLSVSWDLEEAMAWRQLAPG